MLLLYFVRERMMLPSGGFGAEKPKMQVRAGGSPPEISAATALGS